MKEVYGSMALDDSKVYTIEDIPDLPEGVWAELIDGQIYFKNAPKTVHQRISMQLLYHIYRHIEENGGDCQVFHAPYGIIFDESRTTFVLPDICVICDPDKIQDDGCHGAPDWVIEIVSPSTRRMDYVLKLFKYRSSGMREYWIVDPEKRKITVWNFEKNTMEEYSFSDSVPVGIYENFSIDFSRINL